MLCIYEIVKVRGSFWKRWQKSIESKALKKLWLSHGFFSMFWVARRKDELSLGEERTITEGINLVQQSFYSCSPKHELNKLCFGTRTWPSQKYFLLTSRLLTMLFFIEETAIYSFSPPHIHLLLSAEIQRHFTHTKQLETA